MSRPNGLQQAAAMAKLAGDEWQPDQLAGFRVGDLADAPTLGRVEVVALHPPSLLEVRTATGARCKVGWRAVQRINTRTASL